jgi:hypothetical protein
MRSMSRYRQLADVLQGCSSRGGQRRNLLYLQEQLARLPHQFPYVRAFRNSLASKAAMLKRVLVATWGA